MVFSTRTRRLATLLPVAAFSISGAQAFSPIFSKPKQCGELTVSWSSFETPESVFGTPSISVSLVPLESKTHHTPEPFTIDVPCHENGGEYTIPTLPFPFGTQFFASAHVPGAAGLVRRRVSSVLTVTDSNDASCLPRHEPVGRYVKRFGRRQVKEVGVGSIGADQAPSTNSPAASAGPVPPVRVVGESTIPATGRIETPGNAAAPVPEQANGAPVPPIREIGVGAQPIGNPPAGEEAVVDEDAPTTTFFAPDPVNTDGVQEEGNEYYYGGSGPYGEAAPEHGMPEEDLLPEEDTMPEHDIPEEYYTPDHQYLPEDQVMPEEDAHHEMPEENQVQPDYNFEYPEPAPWAEELYQEGRVWRYEYVREGEESPVHHEVAPESQLDHEVAPEYQSSHNVMPESPAPIEHEVMPAAQDPHYASYY